jgi:ATP-dependent DNA helicase RecG
MTIDELKYLKEKEHKIEFKEAKGGNYSFNGGTKPTPRERRHCILGYVVAFANEGGGKMVFGMKDQHPHEVVGTNQSLGATGELEESIYRDTGIRVVISELYEGTRRVLVIEIPGRPYGKVYKFEDVPLMRVGGDLLPMSNEQFLKIITEQEPDFSATICEGLTTDDLDDLAMQKLKEAYAQKQSNIRFLTLSKVQVLNDLDLSRDNKITYAALILLGKQEIIKRHLPQCAIFLEYRNSETLIRFDKRDYFQDAYYIIIEKLWDAVNSRNGNVPVQQGPYIFDIPYFNKEVIREAVNNAVAHRDYRRSSEVVIKQSPTNLILTNPGGFPIGVTINNLININSTPRNRLLAEVLAKTGIVERSGQGVDKIFYQCISEAKDAPDYNSSDDFQVTLIISSIVKDKAFALFISQVQKERSEDKKLSVIDVITLDKSGLVVIKQIWINQQFRNC